MRWKSDGGTELSESKESAVRIKQPIGLRPICHWLDGRVKAHIFICCLSYLLMKTLEHMFKKGGLGDVSTSKLSIPSRIQRQIMDVLGIEYIKSET